MNQITLSRKGNVPMAQRSNTQVRFFRKRLGALALLAVLVMFGGKVWGQASFTWTNNQHITGQNNWGIGGDVIITVDNGATVYIDGQIAPMNYAGQSYSVTIQTVSGGSCTIKRGSGNIGYLFNVYPTNNPYGTQFGAGKLIIGSGVTIDGDNIANCASLINIQAGGSCTLSGVTLQNNTCHNAYYGGGINNDGTLTCNSNCIFQNLEAGVNGGAISSTGKMTLQSCTFRNNSTKNNNGGAIYHNYTGGQSEITSCSFYNNHSKEAGGAIFNSGNLTITGSSGNENHFEGNYSTTEGGVIYNNYSNSITIEWCIFGDANDTSKKNYSTTRGGTISTQTAMTLNDCSFYYNEAQGGIGGAAYLKSTSSLTRCTFQGNHTASNGGALYCGNASTLNTCQFYANYTSDGGGAIYKTATGLLDCDNCDFGDGTYANRNYANKGGAICSTGKIDLDDCDFNYNTATTNGGAINLAHNADSYISNCDNCTFTSNSVNSATDSGGAIYFAYAGNNSTLNFTGCTFTSNTSTYEGGAITNLGILNCTSCTFETNESDRGGALYNPGYNNSGLGQSIYTTCTFKDNEAYNTGGAIKNNWNLELIDCDFEGNIAANDGGAIYNRGVMQLDYSAATVSTFTKNSSTAGNGGAICSVGLQFLLDNTVFGDDSDNTKKNTAAGKGGAFYGINNLSLNSCEFYDNVGTIGGGGLYYGGAITYGGSAYELNVTDCVFNGNSTNNTDGYGGAIACDLNTGTDPVFNQSYTRSVCILDDNSISGNEAVNGGGIYIDNGAVVTMNDGMIGGTSSSYANTATNGGGVYLGSGTFNMIDGSITYNTASGDGGGVYQGGTMNVEGLIVIENNKKGSAANNVYLNTSKLVTIDTYGLECGSSIGINNSTANLNVVTGPVAKVQHAYRNGFFFQDSNAYGIFPSTTATFAPASTNLYLANLTGGAINTFPLATGAVANTDYVGSAGGNITQVKTVKGLAFLAKDVFNGNTYSGKTVTLANDITFGNGDNWEPIGFRAFASDDCNGNGTDHPFSGTFNGNGHIISNLHGNLGYRDFGLFGYVLNGTIQNVIIASGTGGKASENLGGLVGFQNGGQIQYCQVILTSLTGESGATAAIGGIVGRLGSAKLHSCSAIPGTLSNGTAMGGLVGVVASSGILYNSYANTNLAAFGSNSGDVQNCYVRGSAGTGTYYSTATSTGSFTAVQTPYLYRHADNQVTIGGATTNLVDKLNSWSNSYPKWTRTMASPINGDYPILMLPSTTCVGTKSGSEVLYYGTSLNTMLGTHNASGDNIYFWGTEGSTSTPISNGNANANVYFAEDAAIIHTSSIANAHVGITLDNTSGTGGHWHMFSPALSNAPQGLIYTDQTQWPFSLNHPSNMPYYLFTQKSESNATYGYFPSHLYGQNYPANNTSLTGNNAGNYYNDWDYYCYYEPQYHWINFKRNSESHYHEDGNHDPISYSNESTMTRGKGYLVATTYPTLLEAKGTLNQGSFTIAVTRDGAYRTGYNFLGNPYQSYFDFDKFADVNKALWGGTKTNASYLILDKDGYTYYAYSGSTNLITSSANRYLHPHQGFMIVATAAGNATFDNSMRNITATAPFREDHIDYPLVNLIATEEDGNRDIVTVELGRPEVGGAFKQYDMHLGKGCIYTHYEDADYAIAFTLPGLSEIGIRFETDEEAAYTLTWDMENGEFSYLHLIDNITGSDIDCLTATEYRFTSRPSDYKSRFKLVFEYTGVEEQEDGPSTGSGTFAFIMGNELVVNYGPSTPSTGSGTATLQMFDMTGRLVMEKTVCGTQTTTVLPELTAGVYVLRLSDGNGSRVQKVVIE